MERYRQIRYKDLNLIDTMFGEEDRSFFIRFGKIDVWRMRFMAIALAEGQMMGLEPAQIRQAMRQWMKNPTRETLDKAYLDIVVDGLSFDESAKSSGLSARELVQLSGDLALVGDDGSLMSDPKTFATLRQHGTTRGRELVLQRALTEFQGVPKEAMEGRTLQQVLTGMEKGMLADEDYTSPDYWKNTPDVRRQVIELDEPIVITASRPQPETEAESPITAVRDEVILYLEDLSDNPRDAADKRHPLLVRRHYSDGSSEVLVADRDGNLSRVVVTHKPITEHSPVVKTYREVTPMPRIKGNALPRGPLGMAQ